MNCFPPPHKPLFQENFKGNSSDFIYRIRRFLDSQNISIHTNASSQAADFLPAVHSDGYAPLQSPQNSSTVETKVHHADDAPAASEAASRIELGEIGLDASGLGQSQQELTQSLLD